MTTTGSTTDPPSSASPASLPPLPSSSSPPPPHAATKATKAMDALAWAVVAVVTYAWLRTDKLSGVPTWGILAFYASAVLPGGVVTSLGTTLIDRLLPARK